MGWEVPRSLAFCSILPGEARSGDKGPPLTSLWKDMPARTTPHCSALLRASDVQGGVGVFQSHCSVDAW